MVQFTDVSKPVPTRVDYDFDEAVVEDPIADPPAVNPPNTNTTLLNLNPKHVDMTRSPSVAYDVLLLHISQYFVIHVLRRKCHYEYS